MIYDEVSSAAAFHRGRARSPSAPISNDAKRGLFGTPSGRPRVSRGLRFMLLLSLWAAVVGFILWPRVYELCGFDDDGPKTTITKRDLDRYVHEGFPAWRLVTSRACPVSISELDAFIGRYNSIDVWGTPLAMYCASTPNGNHTIVVRSAGEDRELGTADDLWSDR